MYDDKHKVVSFDSKKLTDRQKNWIPFDREFFSLYNWIKTYRHYLIHRHFYAVTDHKPLLGFNKQDPSKDIEGKRVRWSIYLASFEFTLLHQPGKKIGDADAMSRRPHEDEDDVDPPDGLEEHFADFFCMVPTLA